MNETLLDLKARQDAGEHMHCPRCGADTMNPILHHNALSRHTDVYICELCGMNEAMLDMMQSPLPLAQWAFFRVEPAEGDFKAMTGDQALGIIRKEQLAHLRKLYADWRDADNHDFEPYRREAYRLCPGLTAIWEQPFQAAYKVADGQLLIRFRSTPDGIEVAADLVK